MENASPPPASPGLPPEPPPESKRTGMSAWMGVLSAFGTILLCIIPPLGLLAAAGLFLFSIIALFRRDWRAFGLGVLLAYGLTLLIVYSICSSVRI